MPFVEIHREAARRAGHEPLPVATVDHAAVMRSIELFGTEVAPVVRAEAARREAGAAVLPAG